MEEDLKETVRAFAQIGEVLGAELRKDITIESSKAADFLYRVFEECISNL